MSEQTDLEMAESEPTAAIEKCGDMPAAPIIPDGNVASEDELVAAQKAMKMFQGSLGSYRECLDAEGAAIDSESEDDEAKATLILENYNNSVEAEEKIAQEFNTAVRAFKARQQ
ncbi:MAG: hypothetical protein KJP04_01735 [Arenicella sp.]|nr:hypothetical protein [Arenicella sp.]